MVSPEGMAPERGHSELGIPPSPLLLPLFCWKVVWSRRATSATGEPPLTQLSVSAVSRLDPWGWFRGCRQKVPKCLLFGKWHLDRVTSGCIPPPSAPTLLMQCPWLSGCKGTHSFSAPCSWRGSAGPVLPHVPLSCAGLQSTKNFYNLTGLLQLEWHPSMTSVGCNMPYYK